jgi:hypothetical protein
MTNAYDPGSRFARTSPSRSDNRAGGQAGRAMRSTNPETMYFLSVIPRRTIYGKVEE